jgi:hypothetical protein
MADSTTGGRSDAFGDTMTRTEFTQLLTSITALSPGQMRRLRERIDRELAEPDRPVDEAPHKSPGRKSLSKAKRSKVGDRREKRPLTEAEFHQHLLGVGLISSVPDPSLDIDDDDPDDAPVTIEGEPLSETIIRERR